ncbi:Acp1p [Sugiyamaella lignohabitans]|uniref:Acyl carrier protein n=1 Tax=Sugiyamaella lignohabitans TaxID=796027 RepID=A0A167C1P2_9ASCO|nr:Acp1p [Sugiyamaella lignohabitans]ANB11106.1 Acp1p [Sugiyamaella lignohabitans]
MARSIETNMLQIADPSKITPSANFSTDLGLDSLDVVDALFFIEEEFNIEIPDHEADEIHTVAQAVDYILAQPDGK